MNNKQRDLISKFLSDISKGLMLGSALGFATNKMTLLGVIAFLLVSLNLILVSYFLEGKADE